MSCTVLAVPYTLAWVIGAVASAAAAASNNYTSNDMSYLASLQGKIINDNKTISTEHFIEKDFETPFTDKEILVKTLEEHGVKNITAEETEISGSVDNYYLVFKRTDSSQPYSVRISCSEKDNAEEKIDDLNSEYAMNVQEDAYLHIIEKLKENNMQIEEETVEDDNTIVLTINIDN